MEELQRHLARLVEELTGLVPSLAERPRLQAVDDYRELVKMLTDDANHYTTEYYNDLSPRIPFVAQAYVDRTLESRLEAAARYALSDAVDNAASQLERTGVRAIHDASRSTLISNVEREGGKWLRIPSEHSCGWCRILGTRGPVYRSEHAACASHDKCKCRVAVERPGMTVLRPRYMRSWNNEYDKFRREVIALGQQPNLDNIANAWNRSIRAELRTQGIDDSHLRVA